MAFTWRRRLCILLVSGGWCSASLRRARLATGQYAAVWTDVALNLGTGKVEWHGRAELHARLLLITMMMVIIEDRG